MKNSSPLPGILLALVAVVGILFLASRARIVTDDRVYAAATLPVPWSKELLDTFESVPKTDDGRTKSLHTFAYYELLRNRAMPGVRLKVDDGATRSLTPVGWLLDALFYPDQANEYPVFNVEDSDALLSVGLPVHDKKRDRYTYNELAPAREQFFAARTRLASVPQDKQSRLDMQINNLATNIIRYDQIIHLLNFARQGVKVPEGFPDEPLKSKAGQTVPLSDALEGFRDSASFKEFVAAQRSGQRAPFPEILQNMDMLLQDASGMNWFAPPAKGGNEWVPPGGLIRDYLMHGPHEARALTKLRELERLTKLSADRANNAEFQKELLAFGERLTADAKSVDAYGKVAMDRGYLKAGLFSKAKWFFVLLFLVLAVSWIAPGAGLGRVLTSAVKWGAVAGYLIILTGIGWRVLITGWGPVTNLYETIPFITLFGGVFALIMEAVFKNRISLIVAVVVGAFGLFGAEVFETGEATDTMPSLQAVLRSNYWLWTHVTSINIGYATVLLAAIFSMVYIFCRVFDIRKENKALFRMLTQSAYGILCFGLFFSLIGTILGGIWGNDSWGRFWGWDPKENGALIIVLWCLAVLHMRLAGWVREMGLHLCIAFGANFCLFSWFHVNLLGVGLHSYGFTQGLEKFLFISYGLVGAVLLLGGAVKFLEYADNAQSGPPRGPKAEEPPVTAPPLES